MGGSAEIRSSDFQQEPPYILRQPFHLGYEERTIRCKGDTGAEMGGRI